MSKKLIIGLVVGMLLAGILVPAVYAAVDRDEALDSLYEQIYQLRRQVVERRVELEQLTPEQGEQILNRMEERYQRGLEEGFSCPGGGFGKGMGCDERRGEGNGMGLRRQDGFRGNCEK